MGLVGRSFALGVAAGGRSSTALLVPLEVAARLGARLGAARWLARAAVLGEMVGDKLPVTPSRLGSPQVLGRLGAGAFGGGALAAVEGAGPAGVVVAAVAGTAGAFAGSVLGASWRQWAADDGPAALQPDLRAALVEDAAVLATAGALVASSRPAGR